MVVTLSSYVTWESLPDSSPELNMYLLGFYHYGVWVRVGKGDRLRKGATHTKEVQTCVLQHFHFRSRESCEMAEAEIILKWEAHGLSN